MKAAMFHGAHQPMSVEEVDLDDPRDHEVVVRTVGSGVCHSDHHYLDGSAPMAAPAVLGHEAAGVVERVGPGVTRVAPGDHVVVCYSAWCGDCEQCLRGNPNQCSARPLRALDDRPQLSWKGERVLGSISQINAFAEQMLLHERQVVGIDRSMPLDVAALIGCAVVTGVGAAVNTVAVRPLSTVAVFGVGGVGLSVIQGALLAGARRVVAVDVSDEALELATRFGATHTVNSAREDPVERCVALCGAGGADFTFDAAGAPGVATQAVLALKSRGVATLLGGSGTIELDVMDVLFRERTIQGCLMGSNRFAIDIPWIVELYLAGRLMLDELVGRRGGLADVNDLFARLAGGSPGRGLVVFD